MCSVNNREAIILVNPFLSQQMISRLKKKLIYARVSFEYVIDVLHWAVN